MLSREKRLNLKKDFKRVAAGSKLETKYLKLFIKLGENFQPKIGIAVSSKVFKKSTERNRAKRLAAEAFHNIYYQLPATVNIVALPKQAILGVKSNDVLFDLEQALKHEKIIN
ncbi:ribonuclease P protein component [Candidatus Daviesbacteria bacterium]|nr:ribonuclease P protein component [Candidatus Daviesbacteria bacterium]